MTDHAEYLGVPRHLSKDDALEVDRNRDALRSGNPWRVTWIFMRTAYLKMGSAATREERFNVAGMEGVSRKRVESDHRRRRADTTIRVDSRRSWPTSGPRCLTSETSTET